MLAKAETHIRYLCDIAHYASQALTATAEKTLHDHELTARQLAVLNAVAASPGTSQTGLTLLTGIDRSTMADITRRLVKRGLIKRAKMKEDARTYTMSLTTDGHEAREAANAVMAEAEQKIPAELRRRLLVDLKGVVRAIGGESE